MKYTVMRASTYDSPEEIGEYSFYFIAWIYAFLSTIFASPFETIYITSHEV